MKDVRKYIAISIKHSEYSIKKSGGRYVLWGYKRTADDEPRTFSNYTYDPNECELYSLNDWQKSGYAYPGSPVKTDAPVKMTTFMCRTYHNYDTVLVDYDEYMKYYNQL